MKRGQARSQKAMSSRKGPCGYCGGTGRVDKNGSPMAGAAGYPCPQCQSGNKHARQQPTLWLCTSYGGTDVSVLGGPYRTGAKLDQALREHVRSARYDEEMNLLFRVEVRGDKPRGSDVCGLILATWNAGYMDSIRKRSKRA